MSEIPDELRNLWAERDRTKITNSVLMDLRDDDLWACELNETVDEQTDIIQTSPQPQPIQPIPNVNLFPCYKISAQPINLATFHVKKRD
jgi:hypothetical protein